VHYYSDSSGCDSWINHKGRMETVNSLSGGQTSSYISANYPADYNVFALVRIEDEKCRFKDEKVRLWVEDKIQAPFIATAEDDTIIYTMMDLEQFIGKEIHWVTGETFDGVIRGKSPLADYLPNKVSRFCTIEMKLKPIFNWCFENTEMPVEMRIGYRANEGSRADKINDRLVDGVEYFKATFEKHPNGDNKWEEVPYRIPSFPLITDSIYKDNIVNYWKGKPVRFAVRNNCVGCFERNPVLLKHMSNVHPEKFDWFISKEGKGTWRTDMTYAKIKCSMTQHKLFDSDFDECDSGYCEVN